MKRVGRGLLADEPGLGKSRQMIEAASGPTLIVAPAMVLDSGTWNDELAKWADSPDDFVQASYSGLAKLQTTITENGGVSNKPLRALRPEFRGGFETIILDEAHYIKGRNAYWTHVAKKLQSEKLFEATGTPFPNWAQEAFAPLQLLFPEKAKGGGELGAHRRWIDRWFETSKNRWGNEHSFVVGELLACSKRCLERPVTDPCEHYLEFAAENFGDRYLRRLRDDVLTDLPPLTRQLVETPMTPSQRKVYKQLKKDYVAWAEDGTEFVAWNDAAKYVKLDLCSSGLFSLDPDRPPKESESGKLAQLTEDLRSRSRPTFVVAWYKSTLHGCAEYVEQKLGMKVSVVDGDTSRADRRRHIQDFKAGRTDALFGSLGTVAEGLTLTQADMMIFLERASTPGRNEQASRRVHRLGQERPVTIRDYVTPDSADSGKLLLLETKVDRQLRHLNAADLIPYV